ncbi:552_t:CDS:2, partial [Cetraspora pellucida]
IIIIDTPTSPVVTGSLITITWGIAGTISTKPYVLEISNIDTKISKSINNPVNLEVYYTQWVINVDPGTYKFVIHDIDNDVTCSSGTFTVILVSPTYPPSLNSPNTPPQISQIPQNSQISQIPQNSQISQIPQASQISQAIATIYSSTITTVQTRSLPNIPSSKTGSFSPGINPIHTDTSNSIKSVNILGFIGITAGVIAGIMLITTGSIMLARRRSL